MTAKSAAAQALDSELKASALLALQSEGFYAPVVVRAERLGDGLIEALVTVECANDRREARLALIDCSHGPPVVVVQRGWPI